MGRMEHGGVAYLLLTGVHAFDPSSPDAAVDPTTLPAKVAVVAVGVPPVDADFKAAEWASRTKIRILVGIGQTIDPARGDYDVHGNVIGGSEQPRWKAGTLKVY